VGERISEGFELVRPPIEFSFDAISKNQRSTFVLQPGEGSCRLKGQVLIREHGVGVFLGSPWAGSLDEMSELNITLADFPLHSFVPDYLMLLQFQKSNMDELERLGAGLAENQRLLEKAARKAEAASKAKSEFLASVSHEIRTPLNAILGFASLLEAETRGERALRYLSVLLRASENVEALVGDLLDLSRAEKGHLTYRRIRFSLPNLLSETMDFHRTAAEAKDLELHLEFAPETPEWVLGDPRRLQQVLTNLLGNALRYTEDGEIVLSVGPGGQSHSVAFSVRDTGSGIPEDRRSEIFENFKRCTSAGDGLGLGLAISKTLAQGMGGEIAVESKLGEGATFSLSLPLASAGSPTTEVHRAAPSAPRAGAVACDDCEAPWPAACDVFEHAAQHSQAPPCGQRLLIAEDNADNRFLMQEYLRETNHSATFAKDGVEALGLFSPDSFDLVFVDLQMPRLDGYSTIRALRAIEHGRAGRSMPIVVVSADAYQESIDRCLELGAVAHLSKPLRREELLEAIRGYALGSSPKAVAPKPDLTPRIAPRIAALRGRYLENQRDRLRRMNDALERGDLKELTSLAHQVKGTAASFGAVELGEAAQALEERGLAKDVNGVRAALEGFSRALTAAEAVG
jgi:signal transduction histidine kinase/CheY-like chemotaxis protein/HPt (histidine-containing phosphotransfer) domain-containing protein